MSILLNNKYSRWYFSIIENVKLQNRTKLKRADTKYKYYENHHILPQCIFPEYKNLKDNPWNGILLSAKEHFICHHLLTKMVNKDTKEFFKLRKAYCSFLRCSKFQNRKLTSYQYEKLKKLQSIISSERLENKNDPFISKKGKLNHNYGRKHAYETRAKMSQTRKERGLSKGSSNPSSREDVRNKISLSHKGMKHTEETKLKMSISQQNPEVKKAKSDWALTYNPMNNPESRKKIGLSRHGKSWYTDGISNILRNPIDVPQGFLKGFTKSKKK